jgi:ACT domain-containing protein
MNYIEELSRGDTFKYEDKIFVLTTDFKKNNSRLAICLADGSQRWLESSSIISKVSVYILDTDNNIVPIKQDKSNETHPNIS